MAGSQELFEMEELDREVKAIIRNVENFPKEGVDFKDITTLLSHPILNSKVLKALEINAKKLNAEVIIGIDSRGFLYGNSIACNLKVPFVPVRKKGKLPFKTIEEVYSLEYGEGVLEIHKDAIKKNQKVLIHDDLLATGGTALAAANLIERLGGVVVGFSFVIYLSFLNGNYKLSDKSENLFSVTTY
jgi:adenine phosphoribosyltransferase